MAKEISVMLYGLGAIGSFYAFILSRTSRVRLTVVARSNFEAVKKNGLLMNSENHGNHTVTFAKVLKTPAEASEKYDYIVCAHKAVDQAGAVKRIAPAVDGEKTCIVIIQNGVGNEDPFRVAFPESPILSCVTWVGASQKVSGTVYHWKNEDTDIGIFTNPALDALVEQARLDEFTSLLQEGGTPFAVSDNIQVQRWSKVAWNVAWNSLTTLTMLTTHDWLKSSADATPMTRNLMREVIDVAKKCGVPLEYSLIDKFIEKILAMQSIGSSMQTDCKNGKPMEVDVILGTPVRKARELGVATPILEVLYTLLLAVDTRANADG